MAKYTRIDRDVTDFSYEIYSDERIEKIREQIFLQKVDIDKILESLISFSESIEKEEKQEWISKLPELDVKSKTRLFEILAQERYRLLMLETEYRDSLRKLSKSNEDVSMLYNDIKKRASEIDADELVRMIIEL